MTRFVSCKQVLRPEPKTEAGFHACLPDGTFIDPSDQDDLVYTFQSVLVGYPDEKARTCLARHGWRLAYGII